MAYIVLVFKLICGSAYALTSDIIAGSLKEGWLWEENSVCELKVKCLCTFPGHTLEHNGDIQWPFQLHIFGGFF